MISGILVQVNAAVTTLVNDKNKIYEVVNHVRLHLNRFKGVSRRFEMIGKIFGCHIYDDYAHHPTEIRAVLHAARQKFGHHVFWVVFQPHTFRSFLLTQMRLHQNHLHHHESMMPRYGTDMARTRILYEKSEVSNTRSSIQLNAKYPHALKI